MWIIMKPFLHPRCSTHCFLDLLAFACALPTEPRNSLESPQLGSLAHNRDRR